MPIADRATSDDKQAAVMSRCSQGALGDARGKVIGRHVYQRISRLYCENPTPPTDINPGPDTLHFDSHFESGNLASAIQVAT